MIYSKYCLSKNIFLLKLSIDHVYKTTHCLPSSPRLVHFELQTKD